VDVRPFTLPGNKLLDRYRESIAIPLENWSKNWELAARAVAVKDARLMQVSAHRAQSIRALRLDSGVAEHWVVIEADERKLVRLGTGILDRSIAISEPDQGSRFLAELALQALLELVGELNKQKTAYRQTGTGTLAECLDGYGRSRDSRCVSTELKIAEETIVLWLPWQLAEQFVEEYIREQVLAAELLPLAGMIGAIGNEKVNTKAFLGTAELSLDVLSSLGVGDVICLDKSLEESLSLNFAGSSGYFSGYLGKRGSNLAIKIENFVSARALN